ncbi:MAG TPA: KR domain-containing protein [Erwinia persicina]|uniref:KR domain-containing protein n=1 Tax=Erwinia persicina TaxID=55211 RepID=A0A4U3F484_9GAMM|nr:SDR family NAD(P)-dependent oxidoreductase [Erwinia persicina]MBC3945471.1 SDR family NAD(P)-dependent oxidoreductase [Erwinia persicina]MBD8107345.1 SDR family NAD(P)-dependent oxidoreductase [Erwinia persicina]MBD8210435.1 SDR family NAD(P)-dependent oxidoreductase [Erwinia persicina]MCQ4093041.1 SDR family NAD(P)-dependent oxidoreductase [Erwinia persicina]MCQ4100352.1 SDR family NAD(P)-dependent oxidoreductase [Erwinia persicina]
MNRVLITGASSGIGLQLARDYAADGWHVTACGRNEERLETLRQAFPQIETCVFDITDLAETRTALSGKLVDLAILCAGTCEYLDHGVVEAEKVHRVMLTNFSGPVNCLDSLLPQMQPGSRVALVGSTASMVPLPRAEAYGASKAALAYFARSLAQDVKRQQVGITLVLPGFVDTPLTQRNDFAMPMIVDVVQASRIIRRGLAKGKAEIAFPALFAFILRVTSRLPLALQRLLTQKIAR